MTNGQFRTNRQNNTVTTTSPSTYQRNIDPRQANVFLIKSLDEAKLANRFNGYLLSKAFQGDQIRIDSLRRLGRGLLRVEITDTPSKLSLMKMKQFQGTPIEVKIAQTQNTCQGIAYSEEAVYVEDENEMWDFIQERNQDVVRMKLLKQASQQDRKRRQKRPTILTFSGQKAPDYVYIGWERCKVKELQPRPLLCFKCYGFLHTQDRCNNDVSVVGVHTQDIMLQIAIVQG